MITNLLITIAALAVAIGIGCLRARMLRRYL